MLKRGFGLVLLATLAAILGLWIIPPHAPQQRTNAQESPAEGCLSCHQGIETINDRMQPYLLNFALEQYGRTDGFECAICHEGGPSSSDMEGAHAGLVMNPSSMWVQHEGKGCAKCHQSQNSITTLLGKPVPKPVGGELLQTPVVSSDPSGQTGADYTFRMARL